VEVNRFARVTIGPVSYTHLDVYKRQLVGPPQGVFPNPKNTPALQTQRARHQKIARLVAGKFIFPERTIVFRLRCVLWTTMPETAVHKNRELEFWKNKIWLAKHRLIAPPAGDVITPQQFPQRDFRVLVSTTTNPRHYFRPFGFGENVRHSEARQNLPPTRNAVPFHPAHACASGRKVPTICV